MAKQDLFTKAHLNSLRKQYAALPTIDPEKPTYWKLIEFLDSLPQSLLKQLQAADIKFVSRLAGNRVKRN